MDYLILFTIFILTLTSVFAGMQFVAWKLWKHWVSSFSENTEVQNKWIRVGIYIIIIGNVLFFTRFLFQNTPLHNQAWSQWLIVNPGGIYFAGIFLLFAFGVIFFSYRAVRMLIGKLKSEKSSPAAEKAELTTLPESNEISRRNFIKTAGITAFAAPFVISTGLSAATHRNFVFKENTLLYPNLPSGLEGLRIAHVSDIHAGIFMNRNQVAEVFELTNSLHPNMVLITGDFVDTHVSEIPDIRENINMLRTDYGVFGSPGNHDHYASVQALMDALDDRNITMLRNESTELTVNGERISLIGVDDAGEAAWNFADMQAAYRNVNPDSFKLMLSHRPHLFDDPAAASTDLTLAGHTHGGQLAIDFAGFEFFPIDFFHKYSRGLYESDDRKLYVNTGVGLVGVPIRMVRPEITLLTLTSHPENAGTVIRNA